jgi:type II secretory pathway pseudopilin PulG
LKTLLNDKRKLPAVNLLELVIVIAFIAILVTAGAQVFTLAIKTVDRARESSMAELMSLDLIELAISKRNEGWSSLQPGEYYLTEDPDPSIGFVFVAGEETVAEFTRSITISEVQRDISGNIVSSSGTVDPNTYLLTATTSWTSATGFDEEVTLYQYVTNWDGF